MEVETMAIIQELALEYIKDFQKAENLALEYIEEKEKSENKTMTVKEMEQSKYIRNLYASVAEKSLNELTSTIIGGFVHSLSEDVQRIIFEDMKALMKEAEECEEDL